MIKAVLFDLDGTLLDSAADLIASLNHLRRERGLQALPAEDLRHFVSRGADGLIKAGMPPGDEETLQRWKSSFLEHYRENSYNETRPFEGVESLLSHLHHNDIPWGIVTNKIESLSFPILEKTGWLSSLSTVICGDSALQLKPHPEPVLAACKAINVDPQHVLMVGDDLRDIKAGRSAGCDTALALYGYAPRESISDIANDVNMIAAPGDVLDLLQKVKS